MPIDPCQSVIAALRIAIGEHVPRVLIDLETASFEPHSAVLPDPYALKRVSIEKFAAALLPAIGRPPAGQPRDRILHMALRLRELESQYRAILFVCSALDWPWIREAYKQRQEPQVADDLVAETVTYAVEPDSLLFLLGELPFITGRYERARAELDDDENLSIDGVKELLIAARESYRADWKRRARRITPHQLSLCLKYIRNLSLIESRLTPDLYTIVVAAKQLAGDQFALHVVEAARDYPFQDYAAQQELKMGIDQAQLPDGAVVSMVSRLPGPPIVWRSLQLKRRPDRKEREKWRTRWNPYSHCSWPPEDELIENFRSHVFDRAKAAMGIGSCPNREIHHKYQGRHRYPRLRCDTGYDGDIYVKVLPPSHGHLDCAVMLFDSPADPRDYPWRTTWFAEHENESTMAFFASDYREEPVGPGICLATYGGALFLFPPVHIPDVWRDPRLDFAETLEERLLAGACLHSQASQIAMVSPLPPGAGWRRLAKRFGKQWVHLPLGHFSDATVQQLRLVHVLNGKQVRSYAADFIRKA